MKASKYCKTWIRRENRVADNWQQRPEDLDFHWSFTKQRGFLNCTLCLIRHIWSRSGGPRCVSLLCTFLPSYLHPWVARLEWGEVPHCGGVLSSDHGDRKLRPQLLVLCGECSWRRDSEWWGGQDWRCGVLQPARELKDVTSQTIVLALCPGSLSSDGDGEWSHQSSLCLMSG